MLSLLPPELLVQIFKSLPNFETILALRDADARFARIWELHSRAILAAQVQTIRSQNNFILEGNALRAYHNLLQPQRTGCLNPWRLLGSSDRLPLARNVHHLCIPLNK